MMAIATQGHSLAKEKYLTRGDMAIMLSATDFMKQKINDLFNIAAGYNLSQLNRATTAPIIRWIKATPQVVPADGRTVFNLMVSVDDPNGLAEIKDVRADISGVGKLSNMKLVDNGLWGDQRTQDGIFTLQSSVNPSIVAGQKEISIAVANKKGWLSLAKTEITVENKPAKGAY